MNTCCETASGRDTGNFNVCVLTTHPEAVISDATAAVGNKRVHIKPPGPSCALADLQRGSADPYTGPRERYVRT